MENAQETIDIGPKSWKAAMASLEIVIMEGTRDGRKSAGEEARKMAEVADLLPEAIAIIQEVSKFAPSDPLALRIEAFIKSIPTK